MCWIARLKHLRYAMRGDERSSDALNFTLQRGEIRGVPRWQPWTLREREASAIEQQCRSADAQQTPGL